MACGHSLSPQPKLVAIAMCNVHSRVQHICYGAYSIDSNVYSIGQSIVYLLWFIEYR